MKVYPVRYSVPVNEWNSIKYLLQRKWSVTTTQIRAIAKSYGVAGKLVHDIATKSNVPIKSEALATAEIVFEPRVIKIKEEPKKKERSIEEELAYLVEVEEDLKKKNASALAALIALETELTELKKSAANEAELLRAAAAEAYNERDKAIEAIRQTVQHRKTTKEYRDTIETLQCETSALRRQNAALQEQVNSLTNAQDAKKELVDKLRRDIQQLKEWLER